MPHSRNDAPSAPVDRAALAAISNGDAATERRLLNVFRNANVADAVTLDMALKQRDSAGVMRAAHRLLGASKMAGAMALGVICGNIMQAGRCEDWDAIGTYRDQLDRELGRINAYLDMQFRDPR